MLHRARWRGCRNPARQLAHGLLAAGGHLSGLGIKQTVRLRTRLFVDHRTLPGSEPRGD